VCGHYLTSRDDRQTDRQTSVDAMPCEQTSDGRFTKNIRLDSIRSDAGPDLAGEGLYCLGPSFVVGH